MGEWRRGEKEKRQRGEDAERLEGRC